MFSDANKNRPPSWRSNCLYNPEEQTMLHWTLVFLVIALVAALLGFGGIAGAAAGIAKILFFVFIVLWLVSLLTRRSV
jgi:uncharacterized membrane protein YtjA (UPF0391 family)